MKLLLALLFNVLAFAQTASTPRPAPEQSGWIGTFVGYGEKINSTTCGATPAPTPANAGIYEYYCYSVLPQRGRVPTTTAKAGAVIALRTFGPLTLFGAAQAGFAQTATASTGAYNLGGLAVWRFKNDMTAQFAVTHEKDGSKPFNNYMVGIGYTFYKH